MSHKIALLSFSGALVLFGFLGFASHAQAEEACTPKMTVQETKETSVKLKITCSNLPKEKVSVKILVSNEDDDSDSNKTVKTTLGKSGSASLKINGLDSNTKYSFKAKVKKASKRLYSAYSSSVDTTTKGSDYEPEIDKINGITEDSVKLNISCDDLEDEKVEVQVAYKKKKSWSTKKYSLTLDGDGEGSIRVEDLKSDTEYSFKIKIKQEDDDGFSQYSSEKTATTDEE